MLSYWTNVSFKNLVIHLEIIRYRNQREISLPFSCVLAISCTDGFSTSSQKLMAWHLQNRNWWTFPLRPRPLIDNKSHRSLRSICGHTAIACSRSTFVTIEKKKKQIRVLISWCSLTTVDLAKSLKNDVNFPRVAALNFIIQNP